MREENTLGDRLSEAVLAWAAEEPSEEARTAARNLFIDSIGVALAGSRQAGIGECETVLRRYGSTGLAPVLFSAAPGGGSALRLPPWEAAFLNSAMIHALDYDDVYPGANIHIMSCVLPAGLAAAALRPVSGTDLLSAIILGVECAGRLARWYLKRTTNWMWLTTSVIGGFGAVVTASQLLGHSASQLAESFGLYYSQASGNRQALVEHSLAKRLQPGNAARAAVWSALLASEGVTGAHAWIEGDGGLLSLYALNRNADNFEEVADARVDGWQIEQVMIKRYATCGAHHPAIHAAVDLARESKIDCTNIDAIEVFIGRAAEQLVGGPFQIGNYPQTDAQFSAAYGVAAALLHQGFTLERIDAETVRSDHASAKLAAKVRFLDHWDYDEAEFPVGTEFTPNLYKPQLVRLIMRNGSVIERACTRIPVFGPYLAPRIERSALVGKFLECAASVGLAHDPASRLLSAAESVINSADISATIRQWVGDAG